MKRLFLFGVAAVVVACAENPNQPENLSPKGPSLTVLTPPGVNLLACVDGTSGGGPEGGTCTLSADHKKATLVNASGDPDGDVSIVYSFDLTVYAQRLRDITELSYTYKSLNVPALAPTPGLLIYEIPIDSDGNGTFDFWAFIDATTCGVKSAATVNIVKMEKCAIVDGSPALSPTPFENWAAFVAAYPAAIVDNTIYYIMIVSARPMVGGVNNSWLISNVKFGKTGLICLDASTGLVGGGECTLGSDFKSATLDNSSSNGSGDTSGIYSRETTGYGLFLSNIKDLWYKYSGPVPGSGDLTYNIPIDTNGNGDAEYYVEVDASTCRGTPNGAGTIYTVNITRDLVCNIHDPINGDFANWATYAGQYPNFRTAKELDNPPQNYIFIQARREFGEPDATWTILDAKWGAKK